MEYSKTSTMMITHDINAALSIGNRTIMMDSGRIILDISGERKNMTVESLLKLYKKEQKELSNDRNIVLRRRYGRGNSPCHFSFMIV